MSADYPKQRPWWKTPYGVGTFCFLVRRGVFLLGLWTLVILNSLVFIIFVFWFYKAEESARLAFIRLTNRA